MIANSSTTVSVDAVVFDAYGTLFDVQSIATLVERLFSGHGAALSQLWRSKQLEYTWLQSLMLSPTQRREDFADTTAQFLTMRQDMDATPLFRGLPDDKCSCPHWGYVFKGRLTFDCGDHEEVFEAGDAFYIEAGHIPTSSDAGTEYLQFSPTEQLQIVSDTIMRNMQELEEGAAG